MMISFLLLNVLLLLSPSYAENGKTSTAHIGESISYGPPLSLSNYIQNIPHYIINGRICRSHRTLFFKFSKNNNVHYLCAATLPHEAIVQEVIIKKTKSADYYLKIIFFYGKKGLRVGIYHHRIFDEAIIEKYNKLESERQKSSIWEGGIRLDRPEGKIYNVSQKSYIERAIAIGILVAASSAFLWQAYANKIKL